MTLLNNGMVGLVPNLVLHLTKEGDIRKKKKTFIQSSIPRGKRSISTYKYLFTKPRKERKRGIPWREIS